MKSSDLKKTNKKKTCLSATGRNLQFKTWKAFFSDRKKKCCFEPSLPTGSRVSALATAVIISQLRLKPAWVCSSVSPDKPHEPRLAAHVNYQACVHARTQGGKKKPNKNTANMWLMHTRARARALSELTHRSHDEESQLHYWKSPEMPQCGKKGGEKKGFADWQREETASVGE